MAQITGLGRGLSSLIPKKPVTDAISPENKSFLVDDKNKILQIPVGDIEVNPMQPRKVFDHEGLEELIESIKVYGVIQPIIVSRSAHGYELIAGERRLRASKIIGLATVPAIIREVGEQEKLELALIENVQRRNLNAIERAIAYDRLMSEFNLSQEEAAHKLGVIRSSFANTIRLLELPAEIQKALADERITEGHAKVIAGLVDEKEQLDFFNKILNYNFTVRDAERERKKFASKPKSQKRIGKDPLLEEKEDLLRNHLNTKVNIKKKGGEGQIVIEFYSDEEFDSIINQITK